MFRKYFGALTFVLALMPVAYTAEGDGYHTPTLIRHSSVADTAGTPDNFFAIEVDEDLPVEENGNTTEQRSKEEIFEECVKQLEEMRKTFNEVFNVNTKFCKFFLKSFDNIIKNSTSPGYIGYNPLRYNTLYIGNYSSI